MDLLLIQANCVRTNNNNSNNKLIIIVVVVVLVIIIIIIIIIIPAYSQVYDFISQYADRLCLWHCKCMFSWFNWDCNVKYGWPAHGSVASPLPSSACFWLRFTWRPRILPLIVGGLCCRFMTSFLSLPTDFIFGLSRYMLVNKLLLSVQFDALVLYPGTGSFLALPQSSCWTYPSIHWTTTCLFYFLFF